MHINIYENNDENTIQQRKRIYIVCVDWARKASTHLISHRVSTRLALSRVNIIQEFQHKPD